MLPLPLITLIDHNTIMVSAQDSANVPKELPKTIKAREKEAVVLVEQTWEDVWPSLLGEHRGKDVRGYPFLPVSRRIDRVHLSIEVMPTVRPAYTVAISDHRAVVVQISFFSRHVGGRSGSGVVAEGTYRAELGAMLNRGVVGASAVINASARETVTQVQSITRVYRARGDIARKYSAPRRTKGWEFLKDRGFSCSTDKQAYQQLVRLQA